MPLQTATRPPAARCSRELAQVRRQRGRPLLPEVAQVRGPVLPRLVPGEVLGLVRPPLPTQADQLQQAQLQVPVQEQRPMAALGQLYRSTLLA
jgi:hypothetical protein